MLGYSGAEIHNFYVASPASFVQVKKAKLTKVVNKWTNYETNKHTNKNKQTKNITRASSV